MAKWFYYNESGDKIEVTGGQLKGLAKAGMITPGTMVETEDSKTAPARKVKGLTFGETPQSEMSSPAVSVAAVPVSDKTEIAKIGWMSEYNGLKTSAQQGNPEAMFYLGYFSLHGRLHSGKESAQNKQAAQCFTQGAKFAAQDSAAGLCCAGLCSEYGLGVTKDDLTAVKSYEKAAEKGFAFAYLCLAHAYSAGGEFIEKDLKEAAVYSSMAFKQLMRECNDEKEAIKLVAMQCNYSLNSEDLGDHLNIESSKCPKEFTKAFEACLAHFNKFLEVASQVAELNQQYVEAIDNINSGAGEAAVDGIADALGGRRWMFDLKGGAVDAGISLLTNMVSGAIKTNQARTALDENYNNAYANLVAVRQEIGERVKESANRTQKIAARYGVTFNCFDSTVEQMMLVQGMNSVPEEMEQVAMQKTIANAMGTNNVQSSRSPVVQNNMGQRAIARPIANVPGTGNATYVDANALGIGFWDIIKNKYSMMNGRARRKEFWMFSLWCALIAYVPMFFGFVFVDGELEVIGGLLVFVGVILSLALLCPMINLQIRRLHDIGKSGWFWFIGLIPYVGGIILLVLMCLDSQRGDNQYGPNPKGEY